MPRVENGYIFFQTFSEGSYPYEGDRITFKCNQSYIVDGPSTTTCLANGDWSNDITCRKVGSEMVRASVLRTGRFSCGALPKFSSATMVMKSWTRNRSSEVGDFAFYECKFSLGFQSIGLSKVICLADGTWAVHLKCVYNKTSNNLTRYGSMSTCGHSLQFDDAIEIGRSFTLNSKDSRIDLSRTGDFVVYECKSPTDVLQGLQTVFCSADGSWSVAFRCINVLL